MTEYEAMMWLEGVARRYEAEGCIKVAKTPLEIADLIQSLLTEHCGLKKVVEAARVLRHHRMMVEGGIVPAGSVSWNQLDEALAALDSAQVGQK